MIYPEVPAVRGLAAVATGFAVGAAVGLRIHTLLYRLRQRGPVERFLARWCAWYAGIVAGLAVAVAIAGPYVLARAKYGITPTPLTTREVLVTAGFLSLAYAALEPVFGRGRR